MLSKLLGKQSVFLAITIKFGGEGSCTGMLLQSGILVIHSLLAVIDSVLSGGDSDLRTSFQFLPTAAPCFWGSRNTAKIRPYEEDV